MFEALDTNGQVDVVYTDFSKAFDRVSHKILLQKLAAYGFGDLLVQWLGSYLLNRSFFTVVNGFQTQLKPITSGVPQGSHLGPILFNVFVNDLPGSLLYSRPFMYADDLKFCRVIKSPGDTLLLQADLDRIVEWCCLNEMALNSSKCCVVQFCRGGAVIPFQYHVNNIVLQVKCEISDLGVIFDKKLTFISHMENIVSRASRMLGFVLRTVKGFRNYKTKILLYNGLVRSMLEYCSVVWRPHYATQSLRLERIQKRFLWHLMYSCGIPKKKLPSYNKRLIHFNMMSLCNRRQVLDLGFASKIFSHKLDCPTLLNKFKFRVPVRYPRKAVTPLSVPLRKTVFGSNSPIARMSRLLNECNSIVDIHHDSPTKLCRTVVNSWRDP